MEIKKIYIDTETTGLGKEHGLTQVAGVIEIDSHVVECFDLKIKPFPFDERSAEAEEVSGRDWGQGLEPADGFEQLSKILSRYIDRYDKTDKFTIYAYGVLFDSGVLRRFYEKNDDDYYGAFIFSPGICLMSMAAEFLKEERSLLENFKLRTVCEFLKLDKIKKFHDAGQDVAAAYWLKQVIDSGPNVEENLATVFDFFLTESDEHSRSMQKEFASK